MWHFLDYEKGEVPRDTNSLEGGVNSNLKQQRYVHRGIKKEQEIIMFKWDLIRKSEFGLTDFIRNLQTRKTPKLKTINNQEIANKSIHTDT